MAVALIFAVASVGVCSCALILQGTIEEINVASDPPGATVTLNDGETKVTPFSITAPREKDLQFHFSKPGYQSADLSDNSRIEPGFLVVDILAYFIPWLVDEAAGAGFAHQQTSVIAHLDPEGAAAGEVPPKAAAPLPHDCVAGHDNGDTMNWRERGVGQPPTVDTTPANILGEVDRGFEIYASIKDRIASEQNCNLIPAVSRVTPVQRMRFHYRSRRPRVPTYTSGDKTCDTCVAACGSGGDR